MPLSLKDQRKLVKQLTASQRAQLKKQIISGKGQAGSGLFGTLFSVLGPTVLKEIAGPAIKAGRKMTGLGKKKRKR